MAYQLITCPVCHRAVQAATTPGAQHLSVGIHTRLNGTGVLCEGTGHILTQQQESHP
jgi:hypothetical protein